MVQGRRSKNGVRVFFRRLFGENYSDPFLRIQSDEGSAEQRPVFDCMYSVVRQRGSESSFAVNLRKLTLTLFDCVSAERGKTLTRFDCVRMALLL